MQDRGEQVTSLIKGGSGTLSPACPTETLRTAAFPSVPIPVTREQSVVQNSTVFRSNIYKLKVILCRFIAIENALNNTGSRGNRAGHPWDGRPTPVVK